MQDSDTPSLFSTEDPSPKRDESRQPSLVDGADQGDSGS